LGEDDMLNGIRNARANINPNCNHNDSNKQSLRHSRARQLIWIIDMTRAKQGIRSKGKSGSKQALKNPNN